MSICPSCQTVNPDDYQFCQSCGSKIAIPVAAKANDNQDGMNSPQMEVVTGDTENVLIIASEEITAKVTAKEIEEIEQLDASTDTDIDTINSLSDLPSDSSSNLQSNLQSNTDLIIASEQAIAISDDDVVKELESSPVGDSELPPVSNIPNISNMEVNFANISVDPYGDTLPDNLPIDLPKCLQRFAYAGVTDVGSQRDRNEDDFVMIGQSYRAKGKSITEDRSDRGLFVVCDGMGGHDGGEEASAIAISSIVQQFQLFWTNGLPGERKLKEIITNINQEIYDKNDIEQRQSLGRMGTTLVMLALHNLDVAIAHVGDSRLYRVTKGNTKGRSAQLEQVTRDHEVWNQLLDRGLDLVTAKARPDAHQLTQALGPNPNDGIDPAVQFLSLTESTLFLLCSDGLSDNDVIEEHWQEYLLPILTQSKDLETGVKDLIDLGDRLNGHDNLSAILVLCELGDN